MLETLVSSLHIIVALLLIVVVLFQQGKGANIGATFGGASNAMFGPRGGYSVMAKVTTGTAVMFMVTSIVLSIISNQGRTASVIEAAPAGVVEMPTTLPTEGADVPAPAAEQAPVDLGPVGDDAAPVEDAGGPTAP